MISWNFLDNAGCQSPFWVGRPGLPKLRAEAHWERGDYYENLDKRDRALLDYEDAHRFDPGDDAYLESLAELSAALDHEKRLKAKYDESSPEYVIAVFRVEKARNEE